MKIICDWENCKEQGSYKAPIERDNVRKYRLLCLKHIKIFNKTSSFKDFKKSNLSSKEKDAFDILELNYSAKWQEIQQKFKYLVKKYHPDKNHGSKKYEDKLKKITLAYSQLKMNLGKK